MSLQAWFLPSWFGDVRFEVAGTGCVLITSELTALERAVIARWAKDAAKKDWIGKVDARLLSDPPLTLDPITISAPLAEAAGTMAKLLKFNAKGVLTAFLFTNGQVKATEVLGPEALPRWARKLDRTPPAPVAPTPTGAQVSDALAKVPASVAAVVKDPKPVAAVTVHRPSLSCPECDGRPERDRMACDVLWTFLDVDQRMEWKRGRSITVFGNLTGHAYRLHPRDSIRSRAYGRVAFDMDDRVILHNFNRDVPPEEELLSVLIFLQHRENYLRVFGEVDPAHRATPGTIFPNPFTGQAAIGL